MPIADYRLAGRACGARQTGRLLFRNHWRWARTASGREGACTNSPRQPSIAVSFAEESITEGLVSEEPRARVIAPKSHDTWYRLIPRFNLHASASNCNPLGLSFSIAPAFCL